MLELTTTQIAARLGVSERTVQRWIRSEKLRVQATTQHRHLVEESDLAALTMPQQGIIQRNEITALREEFYDLAHQVSELGRIMGQIIADLTAIPEQIEQARLTVPLHMEEIPSSQAEARIAALERRVSELEQIVEAPRWSSDTLPADERLTAKE
jgi:excisionase family DNA binding protein